MKYVKTIQRQLNSLLVDSFAVIGLSLGLDLKKWYGTYDHKPDVSWERTAEKMLFNLAFNGSTQNIELLLQMVISVNQFSIHGAVADMIKELPVGQRVVGKPAAPGQLDEVEILTQPPLAEKNTSGDLKNCQKFRSYPNYAPKQVWD